MTPTPSQEIEPVKAKQRAIPLQNYLTDGVYYDTLYTEADRVNSILISKFVYNTSKMYNKPHRKDVQTCISHFFTNFLHSLHFLKINCNVENTCFYFYSPWHVLKLFVVAVRSIKTYSLEMSGMKNQKYFEKQKNI